MAEHDDFDLDLATARAWSDFQQRLAAAIEAMTDDDSMVVMVLTGEEPEGGSEPYVQFAGFGGDHVRGEVSGNRFLAPEHQLDAGQEAYLAQQGWVEDEYNHYVHLPRAEASRLAGMSVRALRDVFDVPHPAFLGASSPSTAEKLGLGGAPIEPAAVDDADEPIAVVPTDHDHLVGLVDAALTPFFGHPPRKDDDGDIPVRQNSTLVFVRVNADEPIVELFSFVVREVTDPAAARVEVGILNRDTKFVTFVATGDRVLARIQIAAAPFAPAQLRSLLWFMSEVLDEIDDDLALRTGGKPALSNDPPTEVASPETHAEPDDTVLAPIADALDRGDERAASEIVESGAGDVDRLRQLAAELELRERTSAEAASILGEAVAAEGHGRQARKWRALLSWLGRRTPPGSPPQASGPIPITALYQEFWTGVAPQVRDRGWSRSKPPAHHWWSLPAGVGGTHWSMSFASFGCRVELFFGHSDPDVNRHRFEQLARHRVEIESMLGDEELIFDPLPHAKGCRIEVRRVGPSVKDRGDWPQVATWMIDTLARLREAVDEVGGVPSALP